MKKSTEKILIATPLILSVLNALAWVVMWPVAKTDNPPVLAAEIVERKNPPVGEVRYLDNVMDVWVDPETGCHYLYDVRGVWPRMKPAFGMAESVQVCTGK